ncbi:hypothetical protein FGB62_30g216 [Gracilaria domingensis]|nr:hypothetical protein FGB62_30g216 [Gracilaria domingensis]
MGSDGSDAFNKTLNIHSEREPGVYNYGYPEQSPPPPADVMNIYPSRYPMVSDSFEGESLEPGSTFPDLEEIMNTNFKEVGEKGVVPLPSFASIVSSNIGPQPSEAVDFDFVPPSSDLGLQPSEAPEFGIFPSRSPAPFTGVGISASTAGSSGILSGRTAPSRVVGITVTVMIVFGTLLTFAVLVVYGRNINPYRPFITGASLSEEDFDIARQTVPEISNDLYNSHESNSQSRRYEATSLNRDIEPAQRLEAAKLLEGIPDRHCR